MLTKIHKAIPVGRPILSGSGGTLSTQPLNLQTKCHQNILFSLSLKFFNDHDSFKVKYLMMKHILSQQKHSNTRISPHATLLMLRTALLKEKLYAYFQRTQLRNHLN